MSKIIDTFRSHGNLRARLAERGTLSEKTPFTNTFLGATLVIVVGGLVLAWATKLLVEKPLVEVSTPAPTAASSLPPTGKPTSLPSAAAPPATQRASPQIAPPTLAPVVAERLGGFESLTLHHAEAVSLHTLKGSASVTFGEVHGVTFATLLISPVGGPVLRKPVYEAGSSFVVQSGSKASTATVTAVDYSRRTLTLQLSRE